MPEPQRAWLWTLDCGLKTSQVIHVLADVTTVFASVNTSKSLPQKSLGSPPFELWSGLCAVSVQSNPPSKTLSWLMSDVWRHFQKSFKSHFQMSKGQFLMVQMKVYMTSCLDGSEWFKHLSLNLWTKQTNIVAEFIKNLPRTQKQSFEVKYTITYFFKTVIVYVPFTFITPF